MDQQHFVSLKSIIKAADNLKDLVIDTPLELNKRLSQKYNANIFFKREDLQIVRSYKIRGAYNLISSLSESERHNGITTASAGNHAQGVALSAARLNISATIFMPKNTPIQKINKVKKFGGRYVKIELVGDNFDESNDLALAHAQKTNQVFIPPFDNDKIISGQATVGLEILNQTDKPVDYLIIPIGGGGLIAGIISLFKIKSPTTKIIGVEPENADAMNQSIQNNKLIKLKNIDTFVDGAAVKQVGQKTFKIAKSNIEKIIIVSPNHLSHEISELYQEEGIIAEPAGALSVAALESIKQEIKDKNVVCIISGGNNDINRYKEIIDKSLKHRGLIHHYKISSLSNLEKLELYLEKEINNHAQINIEKINYNNLTVDISISYKSKNDLQAAENFLKKIS